MKVSNDEMQPLYSQLTGSNVEGILNTTQPTKANLVGGSDGTKIQAFQVDAQGSLKTVYPDFTIPSASVSSAAIIFSQDCAGWDAIGVQVTSIGSGNTLTFEVSNDNTNWTPASGYNANSTGFSPPATTQTQAGSYVLNCTLRYFRVRVSTYGSGTVTANGYLRACSVPTIAPIPNNQDSVGITGNAQISAGKVRTAVDTTFVAGDAQMTTQTSDMQTLVKPYGLPETDWQNVGLRTDTVVFNVKAAGAAGVRNYLTDLQYQNSHATVGSEIQVLDGATVIWRGYAPPNMTIPAVIHFNTPLRGTAATGMNVQIITTGTNTFINTQGYQAA
jgi:hypothetical protein